MTERDDWRARHRAVIRERLHVGPDVIDGEYVGRRLVPSDVDVEFLDDERKDYVRVGDRFGSTICYVVDDRDEHAHMRELGWDSFYSFVDFGQYLAPEDRPPHARSNHRYELYLKGVEHEAHMEKMRKMRAEMEAKSPMMRLTRRELHIIKEIFGEMPLAEFGEPLREPDAEIYCGAVMESGRTCWEKIGRAWQADEGWWLSGHYMPFPEMAIGHLQTALWAVENGETWLKEAELAWYDAYERGELRDPRPFGLALSEPKEGEGRPPWVMIGCPRHFNAAVDYPTMREWVKKARRSGKGVSFDCSKRILGRLVWSASEQTFLVE